jgi:Zn-dependent protease
LLFQLTLARVAAIDIAIHWRWPAVLVLTTALLAHSVLPTRFPSWEPVTLWLVSALVVLLGEGALLVHELTHAAVLRRYGQPVHRIVFHGFIAETVAASKGLAPAWEAAVALSGPGMNLAVAGVLGVSHTLLRLEGPADVLLLLGVFANVAMAVASLLPLGHSDGARALRAMRVLRSSGSQ